MILDALLAFGIVMSSATQMVLPGGLTIGEASLVLWILLAGCRMVLRRNLTITPGFSRLAIFWSGLFIAMMIGLINGYMTKVIYATYVIHDSFAYGFLTLITCLAALQEHAAVRLRRSAWFTVGFSGITLALQALYGWGIINWPTVNQWYWDRFQGWTQNPNQLALYCALYGPIALYLGTTTRSGWGRIGAFCGLVFPYIVGRMTKSDTFLVTTVMTWIVFLGLRYANWLKSPKVKSVLARQIAILLVIGAVPMMMALAPLAPGELQSAFDAAKSQTRAKGGPATEETAARRLQLWTEAVDKGMRSGSLGLGPGAHLETRSLNEPFYKLVQIEAHNSMLDIYVQGGMLALSLLIWLVGSAFAFAWRAKQEALVTLVASLAVFSFPHLIIRHPIVWFCVTLCLVTGYTQANHAAVPRRIA